MSSEKENRLFNEEISLRRVDHTEDSIVYNFATVSMLDEVDRNFREHKVENDRDLNDLNQRLLKHIVENADKLAEIDKNLAAHIEKNKNEFEGIGCKLVEFKYNREKDYKYLFDWIGELTALNKKLKKQVNMLYFRFRIMLALGIVALVLGITCFLLGVMNIC